MISAERRSALDALDVARPDIDRLEAGGDPETVGASLRAAWSAVEAALRSLLGEHGTPVTGHPLIREARQHQLITFDQANALAAFHAMRERLDFPEYVLTDADMDTARTAFEKLRLGLQSEGPTEPATPRVESPAPAVNAVFPGTTPGAMDPALEVRVRRPSWLPFSFGAAFEPAGKLRMPRWLLAALVIVVVIGVVGVATVGVHRTDPMLQRGIDDYAHGRHDVAASEFQKAAQASPTSARPHVYLARIDRESGNFTGANDELQTALRLEPDNEPARREMGSLLLAQGNYDLARTFYIHALEIDNGDLAARGWLGCALIHLGRNDEGVHFLDLAGDGPWSVCRQPVAPSAAKTPPGHS